MIAIHYFYFSSVDDQNFLIILWSLNHTRGPPAAQVIVSHRGRSMRTYTEHRHPIVNARVTAIFGAKSVPRTRLHRFLTAWRAHRAAGPIQPCLRGRATRAFRRAELSPRPPRSMPVLGPTAGSCRHDVSCLN